MPKGCNNMPTNCHAMPANSNNMPTNCNKREDNHLMKALSFAYDGFLCNKSACAGVSNPLILASLISFRTNELFGKTAVEFWLRPEANE